MAYHHKVRSEHRLSTLCLSLKDAKIEGKSEASICLCPCVGMETTKWANDT